MTQPTTIVAQAVFIITACTLPGLLVGGLAGEIRGDLGLSGFTIGLAAAAFWLAAAVASNPAGRVGDHLGPTTGVRVGGGLAAAGALGAAAANSPAILTAALAVGGFANAFATPGVSALASRAIPLRRQGFAFGVELAGPAAAALLAGLALPIVAGPSGWRQAFILAAALSIGAAMIAPREAVTAPHADPRSESTRLQPLLMLTAGATAANAAAGALLTFLVVYCIEIGLSTASAGVLLAAASGGAIAVRLGLGLLLAAGQLVESGSYPLIWCLCAGLAVLAAGAFYPGGRTLCPDGRQANPAASGESVLR